VTTPPLRRHVRVLESCTSEQVQEIRVRGGDSLAVGHRNQQHPEFVWSATENGSHGWVPEDYIEFADETSGVARRDYDSTHLTVAEGETLEVLEEVGDYLLCRGATGVQGWVPVSCVQDVEEE